jgi:hypothetical protein
MFPRSNSLIRACLPVASLERSATDEPQRRKTTSYLLIHLRPPPLEAAHPTRVDEAEENDHQRERETGVERRRHGHGVFAPPGGSPPANDVVECEAHKSPDGKIEAGL